MVRNPVLLAMSALAALQVLAATAGLADLVGAKPAAWFVLAVAAVQAGAQFWVRGQVTPTVDPRNDTGARLRPVGQIPPVG